MLEINSVALLYFFPTLFIFVSELKDYLHEINIVPLDFFPSCFVPLVQDTLCKKSLLLNSNFSMRAN